MSLCTLPRRRRWLFIGFYIPLGLYLLLREPYQPQGAGNRPSGPSVPPHAHCLPDQLDAAGTLAPAHDGEEAFLLYAPQFGMSNQLVALRNAVVWALVLNRTLVLPHLLGHATADVMAAHSAAFDLQAARRRLAPLRVREIDTFLQSGLAHGVPVLALSGAKAKFSKESLSYFMALSDHFKFTRVVDVPLSDFHPRTIAGAFGGCGHRRLLAFRSMFGTLDIPSPEDYPRPGFAWLNKRAMPALLTLAPHVASLVGAIHRHIAPPLIPARGSSGVLGCAHIRRGDFEQECAKYADERKQPSSARSWVLSHHANGWGCWLSEAELVLNLRALRAKAPHMSIYVSIENASLLADLGADELNLTSLATAASLVRAAETGALGRSLPRPILDVLLDHAVCSRARHLLLNVYSTFSQLVMGHIGMAHPLQVGWTRSLNSKQQKALGVTVQYWKRRNPSDASRLIS